ncbi:MAG: proline/glycine betaine transporter [Methanocella sp. PtaU1.Bin125]|nr:MAG: proline/glycine betaine transporter [Methanocella sp. PtaU1.Bin125]
MVNDSYSNVIPPLLPLLQATYGLTYALSGFIMTVFTITSSVIQPVFGYIADRHGRRWLIAFSVLWIAFFMSMVGAVSYLGLDNNSAYIAILVMVGLAGFGSSAYHPQASAMVPRISGNRKGVGMSVFSAGGNLGYAIMPLLVVPVVQMWGLAGTVVLFIPGLVTALLLQRYAPEAPQAKVRPGLKDLWADIMTVIKPLTVVIGIVCSRAWLFFGLITFLPLYLAAQGEPPETAGTHLFIILLFGAIGTLLGGWASDRYGRKFVIAGSLLLTGPLLFLALETHGVLAWALMALAGLALLASFSPAVLFAQGLIPRNQGMASGIILGFAIGIGGLGVSVTGAVADAWGIGTGTYSLVLLPIAGFLLTLLLPGRLAPERR